jgi:hypothetical protein
MASAANPVRKRLPGQGAIAGARPLKIGSFILALALLAGAGWAAPEKPAAARNLAITLIDGSQVVGVPKNQIISIRTDFAQMDLPLERIASITLGDDRKTVAVVLQNGDKFKGSLDGKPLEIETAFGKITVAAQNIKRIDILAAGLDDPNLKNDLILHYSFDKDDEKVTDSSPEHNDGKVFGVTWERQGKVGLAASFNGVDNFIEITPKTDVAAIKDFTIAVWIFLRDWKNQPNDEADRQYIFDGHSHSRSEPGDVYRDGFCVACDGAPGAEKIQAGYMEADGSSMGGHAAANLKGAWHHLVFARRGNEISLYLDGELRKLDEAAKSSDTPLNMQHNWFIGTFSGNNPNYRGGRFNYSFKGLMDELMIWKRGLTEAEVKQLFNLQK